MRSKRGSECESSTNEKAVDAESGNKSCMCRARFLNSHCLSAGYALPETRSAKAPHWLFIESSGSSLMRRLDLSLLEMKGSSAEVPKGSTTEGESETGK